MKVILLKPELCLLLEAVSSSTRFTCPHWAIAESYRGERAGKVTSVQYYKQRQTGPLVGINITSVPIPLIIHLIHRTW